MRGLLLDLTPLRGREFRLLFLGQLISSLGSMITFVALPFQMYEETGSTLAVGALGICEFIAIVTVALVSGALADAFDRRLLVLVSELGSAAVMAALVANSMLGDPHLWVLYVCATLLASFYALLRPPLDALVPRVVPREQIKAAMALGWLRGDVAMVAGPAVGGVLIAAFGLTATWGMDAVSGLFRSVMWNETIPDRLRGRLAGVEMISYTSGPTLGNFEAGAVASFAGVRTSIVSGGVMCVVGTAVLVAALPALWRYDARHRVEA